VYQDVLRIPNLVLVYSDVLRMLQLLQLLLLVAALSPAFVRQPSSSNPKPQTLNRQQETLGVRSWARVWTEGTGRGTREGGKWGGVVGWRLQWGGVDGWRFQLG
jgi:hypothetical protein